MEHHLSIDIETFSSVDIQKAGLYKYAQSPDFQVLLLAWSLDGGAVQLLDQTAPDVQLPPDLSAHLFHPETVKHAFNAAFECYCLSWLFRLPEPRAGQAAFSRDDWLSQWRCTMLHGLYCGYTAGLAATGAALGLPSEKQKLAAGRALIRYFCVPCAATASNGGRTRNLPKHDPGKWALFCDYCRQDVVTETEIERRLSSFPVPDFVQRQWETDQRINARGVAVDTALVDAALTLGANTRSQLLAEASQLSGLSNPNSVAQLSRWLESEIDEEISDLRKNTVTDLLKRGVPSEAATRMLEIRQELGKTSTKKYNALEAAVCADGRVRGLLQFYGANRTGRWAGRIVQPQNLPRTYLEPLGLARDLCKGRQAGALRFVYGSVPDTLSQLIRTAFVAEPGKLLVDADFSAIEARVLAWLAGEQWVLDVFRTHGKIYESTAAQMFGIPIGKIKKGNPEYAYRARGKVATLALGYQGGVNALINMGALRDGIPEEDLPEIKSRWRQSNPRIVDLWYSVQNAAVDTIRTGRRNSIRNLTFAREADPANGQDFLTVLLPSGRKLYYAQPHFGVNRFGEESPVYRGMDQTTKRWKEIETYGGKLVENITQAVARDCLAEAIERLETAGYPVVFHVHDEVVIETEPARGGLAPVVKIMSEPPAWALDLPLNADGWVNPFFKKD